MGHKHSSRTSDLAQKYIDFMKEGGDGVAQTFFGATAPPPGHKLQGPSGEQDVTDKVTEGAVKHISRGISEVRLAFSLRAGRIARQNPAQLD